MEQTLLLNATYEPLTIVDWQRAITLWCSGKVEIIAEHDREVRAVTFTFKLPSVVRLLPSGSISHPSAGHCTGGGASFGSPSADPPSTQPVITSIWP